MSGMLLALVLGLSAHVVSPPPATLEHQPPGDRGNPAALVALVSEAAALVEREGEMAFEQFRIAGSRWREDERYVFVLDLEGNMLVHPDTLLEGGNRMDLVDVNGKRIIRGLLAAATTHPDKPEGWYHYQWPVPGGLLPRWKSSYVRLVAAPSGTSYVVGSGVYTDRMERAFVVDLVTDAVAQLEREGEPAFRRFRDPAERFRAKDAYVFVLTMDGVELVNPAFPNLEGRGLLDLRDTEGKALVREMLRTVRDSAAGWVDYMWPRPGEGVSTRKSTYVTTARVDGRTLLVGCGVYLADAPRAAATGTTRSAAELVGLVRAAADLLARQGEGAFAEFRRPGRWLQDDLYLFVWTLDGTRVFHAANPAIEGRSVREITDVLGRPWGRMFLDAAASPAGEGWVHYMYPEPGGIFPVWKTSFIKQVTFPSGQRYLVGSGIYRMQMDRAFIEDLVDRAAALLAARGRDAFPALRDRTGPFVFMDTYVFVDAPDGTELVNAAQPSLEGRDLSDVKDVKGKPLVREYIAAALERGSAWVEYYWYRPGDDTPARKLAYVRKVEAGTETFIVGSGIYSDD